MQFRKQTQLASGGSGAAVSAEATITGAPRLQGSATAGRETARGGAIGSKAGGQRPQEEGQGRRAAVEARGEARAGARTVGTKAGVEKAARKVMARSALGRWPNEALQVRSVSLKPQPNKQWGKGSEDQLIFDNLISVQV